MISQILDILRLLITAAAFFFGYMIGFSGNGYHPEAQLHFMIPMIVAAIAGLSGIEGLLFSRQAAEAKGYETGSNYQKQSAIALISYAVISLVVFFLNWGTKAELTIFFTFLFFLFFSGINHAWNAIVHRNLRWQNINRPFLAILLIAGMIYPVIMAIKDL